MRVLAVGDSFVSSEVMRAGLADLGDVAVVTHFQIDESLPFAPATESEQRLGETAGSPAQLIERIGEHEVLIVHGAPVTDEVLAAAPALRLIGCARGGPVNVDLEAAAARGIPVVNTPGKNAEAVAEEVIALLVMTARGFRRAMGDVDAGVELGASAFEGAQYLGRELAGACLGLVGYGHVGRKVAKLAAAFGMRVVAFDPYRAPDDELVEAAASLDELLGSADFVSVHARASRENENLFGAEQFRAMRPGSIFVNTARETLVDEPALSEALGTGHLAGAGLDVVRPIPGGGRHPLLAHGNVVLLPHIGGATHETLLRGVTMLADEVRRFAAGDSPVNLANNPVTV